MPNKHQKLYKTKRVATLSSKLNIATLKMDLN